MFLINGGIPRSGTVLVGEIMRALLQARDIPLIRYSPQERRNLPEFSRRIADDPSTPVTLVHTHVISPDCLKVLSKRQDQITFWNLRDPRDSVVSLTRLHQFDLDHAVHSMNVYLTTAALVRNSRLGFGIRYEALVADTPAHIRAIARAMGFETTPEEIAAIAQSTSVERHRAIMEKVRAGHATDAQTHPTRARVMQEDAETLINDTHIQSGQSGRWKSELDADAKELVNQKLGRWIKAFGYELDVAEGSG